MGKHTAPRTRSPLWAALGYGLTAGALLLTAVVAASVEDANRIAGTPHAEAQPAVSAVCGTDAECAQWSDEHGQQLGYGATFTAGHYWTTPQADQEAYPEYCGDAALAEREYISDVDDQAAGMRCAASYIVARLDGGQQVFEDFTYPGAPDVVTEFNEPLVALWQHYAVDVDETEWLRGVAAEVPQHV